MFTKKPVEKTDLDDAIQNAFSNLSKYEASTPEYKRVVDQLTALSAIQSNNKPDRMSKDALAMIVGNLAGIFVIVGHERAHIVTSKAIQFVGKFR